MATGITSEDVSWTNIVLTLHQRVNVLKLSVRFLSDAPSVHCAGHGPVRRSRDPSVPKTGESGRDGRCGRVRAAGHSR